ncbi:MAG TPA: hypothetical protein P5287_00855 [bacterium]|nr:hypothetical protein [bacterium]
MANGMEPIYNLWNLAFKMSRKEADTIWMKVPKIFRNKEDEQVDIMRKQMSLILDGPDRKNRPRRAQ